MSPNPERRHHPPHSRLDRLHHRGADLHRQAVAQQTDLPSHQRAAITVPTHEEGHLEEQEGSCTRFQPALCQLCCRQGHCCHEGRHR